MHKPKVKLNGASWSSKNVWSLSCPLKKSPITPRPTTSSNPKSIGTTKTPVAGLPDSLPIRLGKEPTTKNAPSSAPCLLHPCSISTWPFIFNVASTTTLPSTSSDALGRSHLPDVRSSLSSTTPTNASGSCQNLPIPKIPFGHPFSHTTASDLSGFDPTSFPVLNFRRHARKSRLQWRTARVKRHSYQTGETI